MVSYELYCDGSTFDNSIIICEGNKKKALMKFHGKLSNNDLEWYGVLMSIKFANYHVSDMDVKIYCDSKLVVNQLNGSWKINKEGFMILKEQCVERMNEGKNIGNRFSVRWIRRNKNFAGIYMDERVKAMKRY